MARYNIQPNQGPQATAPQQILHDVGKPQSVLLENVGSAQVWVSENASALQTVDALGNPTDGFVLQPGQTQYMDWVVGALYATSLAGGTVNCTGWPRC